MIASKPFVAIVTALSLGGNLIAGEFVLEAKKADLKRQEPHVLFVPLVQKAPNVDGRLEEAEWQKAASVRKWLEYPSGSAVPLEGEMRLLADSKNVYLAFNVAVEDMAKARLKEPKRGGDEYGGSLTEVFLDPTGVGKEKFQFCANPLGLRYDGRNDDKGWNGKWRAVGNVRKDGWSLEAVIPVADLGRPQISAGTRWAGNFAFVTDDDTHTSWTGRWGSAGTDYGILFFGSAEAYAKTIRPKLKLWIDREVYDLRDVTAVALARTEAGMLQPDMLGLRLRLSSGDQAVATKAIAPLPGLDVDLTLDLKSLAPGDYKLAAELQSGGKTVASADAKFTKKKRKLIPEGRKQGHIAIRVWPESSAKGTAWPISTGVPFAQDVLWSPDNVRLLGADGKEVPCQTEVRSTWNRKGSIQWLGVDFVPTLSPTQQTFVLEYGPEVRRKAPSRLRCEETQDAITVTTGPLRFTVGRKRFRVLDRASVDLNGNGQFGPAEQIIKPSDGAGPYLVDHEGNRYEAAADRDVEVVVEDNGPVRVTICATGWYVKRGTTGERTSCELPTDRLCKFRIRLSAYDGLPLLRLAVSTVITYDSTKVRLRDLALGFTPQNARNVAIGIKDQRPLVWDEKRLLGSPRLLQYRWDRSVEDTWRQPGGAQGWVQVAGKDAAFRIAVRNFWKLFPKEIEWRDNALLLHIWPAHGRDDAFGLYDQLQMHNIYKLWYCHQGRELDFRFPDAYYQTLDEECTRTKAFGAYFKAMPESNAQGLCIHNDLLLSFGTPDDAYGTRGKVLSFLADEDPHAAADPAYACATGVFGPMLHADMGTFGQVETMLRNGFNSLAHRTLPNNEYGMFIYGGAHTYWYHYKKPRHAGIHRVWITGHYAIARMPLVQYARTGDPLYLRWGRDFGANLRDIAICHYESDERRFKYHSLGAMYHCKGFAPWAGDAHVAAHPTSMDFLAYDYYLTGSRRSRDVLLEWVEGLKKQSPGGHGTREGIQPLADMVEAYRLTWDAALIELMGRFARPVFFGQPLAKQGWWDYHPLLLMRYHGLTGCEKAVEAYREVIAVSKGGYGGGSSHIDGYLTLLDGKTERLKPWQSRLYRDGISYVNQPGIYANGHTSHVWIRYVYYYHKVPYLLKAMKEAGLKPVRPTLTAPTALLVLNRRSLVVVREPADQAIPVKLAFTRKPSAKVRISVHRSNGKKTFETELVPSKEVQELAFTIPADGEADDYLIAIEFSGAYDAALWPLTELAHEVAILTPGKNVFHAGGPGSRCCFAPDAGTPPSVTITSDTKMALGMELLDAKQNVIARASDSRYVGDPQTVEIPSQLPPPLSMYFSAHAEVTFGGKKRLVVGLRPEALFVPKIIEKPVSGR